MTKPNGLRMLGLSGMAAIAVAAGVLALGTNKSFAVGDDAGPPTCASGKVWDEAKKDCVEQKSGVVPDKSFTDYAYALAKEGRYSEALATLDLLINPNTPAALNYRGYATRKLGRVEEGIGYYLKAVAMDPSYTLVREYLGEAYISLGRIDLARQQLSAIQNVCGVECEPAALLSKAIDQAI